MELVVIASREKLQMLLLDLNGIGKAVYRDRLNKYSVKVQIFFADMLVYFLFICHHVNITDHPLFWEIA